MSVSLECFNRYSSSSSESSSSCTTSYWPVGNLLVNNGYGTKISYFEEFGRTFRERATLNGVGRSHLSAGAGQLGVNRVVLSPGDVISRC